jgi:hypothetical protein
MDAPRCIVCGQKHWSRQPCPAFADVIAEERKQQARRALDSVTKNLSGDNPATVTKNPTVTEITKPFPVTANSTRPRGRPRSDNPLSQAERARRYRERKALQTPQQPIRRRYSDFAPRPLNLYPRPQIPAPTASPQARYPHL